MAENGSIQLGQQTVLNPNVGRVTVLSPVSEQKTEDSILLFQINALTAPQIVNKQNRINAQAEREINQLGFQAAEIVDLQEETEAAADFLTDVIFRANSIRDKIDSAIKVALQANDGDSNSFPQLASSFDVFINNIISTANNGPVPNLIGEQPQENFSFRTSTNGATYTVGRTFLGSNYTITEDVTNDVFVRVDDSNSLEEIDGTTGAYTGTTASIFSGIELNAFDSSTNAITITLAPATASPTVVTGTLAKTGLGIGNAFLYANLETQDGRDRAIADLEAAKGTIDLAISGFEIARTQAGFVSNKTFTQIDELETEGQNILQDASIELQIVEAEAASLNILNQNLIQSQRTFTNELLKLIPVNGLAGKFTSSLIDLAI